VTDGQTDRRTDDGRQLMPIARPLVKYCRLKIHQIATFMILLTFRQSSLPSSKRLSARCRCGSLSFGRRRKRSLKRPQSSSYSVKRRNLINLCCLLCPSCRLIYECRLILRKCSVLGLVNKAQQNNCWIPGFLTSIVR